MKPGKALITAAAAEFLSPFLAYVIGFGVAGTIENLVKIDLSPECQCKGMLFLGSAVLTSIAWNLFMLKLNMPASSSHTIIGAIIGAGIAAYGFSQVNWANFLIKVVLMMLLSPVIGFIAGYISMKITDYAVRNSDVRVNRFFIRAQTFNMVFLAFNHSFNDSQKSIGAVMLLYLICFGQSAAVPLWVTGAAGLALALGLLFGGFRIIKTVGNGIYRVRPKHSFVSQLSSSLVVFSSSLFGAPVSASQIVTSSIMGVGAAQKLNAVRWLVVKKILLSWLFTIPSAAVLAGGIYLLADIVL